MLTEKELNTFESHCVNIGYNMCKAETMTILIDLNKECESKEGLQILRQIKDRIMNLKCVWKGQPH